MLVDNRDMKNGKRKNVILQMLAVMLTAVICLTGCTYQPPYKRGYNEGYAKGYSDGSSGAPEAVSSDGTVSISSNGEGASDEKAGGLSNVMQSSDKDADQKDEEKKEEATESAAAEESTENTESGEQEATADAAAETTAESAGEGEAAESQQGSDSATGAATKDWGGRIIRAEAVNEAMYSNPEVIDGLRQIYDDKQIFGMFVGDSGTNQLHKVGGPHFASLKFEELVVFDETKSVEDVINEGFYTKCSCMD